VKIFDADHKIFQKFNYFTFFGAKFETHHFVSGVLFIEELQAFFYLQF